MGTIRLLPQKTDAHWRLAQKTSGNWFFLMGLLMTLIGYYLKTFGHTNYFFDRDAIIGISNYAHFYYDRKKLQRYDLETGGNDNEYFND